MRNGTEGSQETAGNLWVQAAQSRNAYLQALFIISTALHFILLAINIIYALK